MDDAYMHSVACRGARGALSASINGSDHPYVIADAGPRDTEANRGRHRVS